MQHVINLYRMVFIATVMYLRYIQYFQCLSNVVRKCPILALLQNCFKICEKKWNKLYAGASCVLAALYLLSPEINPFPVQKRQNTKFPCLKHKFVPPSCVVAPSPFRSWQWFMMIFLPKHCGVSFIHDLLIHFD